VVAVVHETDLEGGGPECRGDPVHEWLDVAGLVAGGNDEAGHWRPAPPPFGGGPPRGGPRPPAETVTSGALAVSEWMSCWSACAPGAYGPMMYPPTIANAKLALTCQCIAST